MHLADLIYGDGDGRGPILLASQFYKLNAGPIKIPPPKLGQIKIPDWRFEIPERDSMTLTCSAMMMALWISMDTFVRVK